MSLPSSGSIKFSDLRNTLGPGNISVPIKFSDYKQNPTTAPYYTKGIPGITDTNLSISQFYGKKNALKSGFTYKVFRGLNYLFTVGLGGAGGSYSQFRGGGGAGGISISLSGNNVQPNMNALAGGSANGGEGGQAGMGFGAGGGGGGYWYAVGSLPGGQGATGFCYIYYTNSSNTEYFTQTSTTHTFTSTGTVKIILMGGGGGGESNAFIGNSVGAGGGGAGFIQTLSIYVTSGTTATITVGNGGYASSNGGDTSITYNSKTYTAAGGKTGTTQGYGGTGSSAGGSGGQNTSSSGSSSGGSQFGTPSQGTSSFTINFNYISGGAGGYFSDNPSWFAPRNYINIGTTTDMTNINTATGGIVPNDNSWQYFSIEWFGYFCPTVSGNHTFYLNTDDASYLWIGNTALSGFTTANALINNGGIHGPQKISGVINLTANTFYPIRIQYGQAFSIYNCSISFSATGISETSNFNGYIFNSLGSYSNYSAENSRVLKSISGTNTDGVYFINVNGTSTATYCLMDNKWDGGGWMMLMKATRGTTFNYDSTYWTDINTTLNTTDTTRNNADAKFNTMNYSPVKDVMALWPDAGLTGGSIAGSDVWSWLVNDYYGSSVTIITGLAYSNSRDVPTFWDPLNFPGYNASIWSSQTTRRHIMGGGAYVNSASLVARWGFIWNNEADFGSSDVVGGIGITSTYGASTTVNYSAGDFYGCCGTVGLNRSMRVELYGR